MPGSSAFLALESRKIVTNYNIYGKYSLSVARVWGLSQLFAKYFFPSFFLSFPLEKNNFKYVGINFHFLGTGAAYLAAQAPRGTLHHNQSINPNN